MYMKTNKELEQYAIPTVTDDFGVSNTFNEIFLRKNRGFFGVTLPVMHTVFGAGAQTAANFTAPFFIANRSYQILEVIERHEVAGSDGGAVTIMLKKVPSGTAPASGSDVLTAGLSLKATANINQTGTIGQIDTLVAGDALSLVTTGTLTALVGVTFYVLLKAI